MVTNLIFQISGYLDLKLLSMWTSSFVGSWILGPRRCTSLVLIQMVPTVFGILRRKMLLFDEVLWSRREFHPLMYLSSILQFYLMKKAMKNLKIWLRTTTKVNMVLI